MRVLLVEDELELGRALSCALAQHGFVVDHVDGLELAREAVAGGVHEVVLLDRQLRDGDGLTLLAEMRKDGITTPVIILTARNDPPDRIAGLDLGADDYIGKPFLIGELLARVRAAGRRSTAYQSQLLCEGNVTLDLTNSEIEVNGRAMVAPRREMLLLKLLLRRAGRTVLRRTLEEGVYGYDTDIQSNALDSHVSRLRKRLGDAGADVTIHAIRGVGYLLKVDA
jgi:two-component system, OmpR family, response regulator